MQSQNPIFNLKLGLGFSRLGELAVHVLLEPLDHVLDFASAFVCNRRRFTVVLLQVDGLKKKEEKRIEKNC